MRRISIGTSKEQRICVTGSQRRTSLPPQLQVNTIELKQNGHIEENVQGCNVLTLKPGPLPRIRRLNDSINEGSSNVISPNKTRLLYGSPVHHTKMNNSPIIVSKKTIGSPRRYPTHQPQFSGIGILPTVHLQKTPRAILTEQNSSMLGNSVTVKVAAPDVLKPPTPVFVQIHPVKEENINQSNPCDTESVMTALREKRKRNLGDEETVPSSPEHMQATKRRRQVNESVNGEISGESNGECSVKGSSKRPSAVNTDDELLKIENKRQKSEPIKRKAVGVKNALEASFSSSKRWMDKVKDYSLNTSRDSSISCGRRSTSGDRNIASRATSRNTSVTNTPRHSITLEDDILMAGEHATLSNTSTPVPGTSGRTTPLTEDEQCGSVSTTPKKMMPLMIKEGSTKRRLIPSTMRSDDLSRVPRLRNQLTVDDFQRDRKAEIDRVRQMLQEVDDEHQIQQGKKKSLFTASESTKSTNDETSTVKPVTATSNATLNTALSCTVSFSSTDTSSKPILSTAPLNNRDSNNTSSTVQTTSSSQFNFGNTPSTQISYNPASSSNTNTTITAALKTNSSLFSKSNINGISSTQVSGFQLPINTSSLPSTSKYISTASQNTTVGVASTGVTSKVSTASDTADTSKRGFTPVFATPVTSTNQATLTTSSSGGGFTLSGISSTSTKSTSSVELNMTPKKVFTPVFATPVTSTNQATLTTSSSGGGFTLSGISSTSTKSTSSVGLNLTPSFSFGESSGKLPSRPGGGFNFGTSTVLPTTSISSNTTQNNQTLSSFVLPVTSTVSTVSGFSFGNTSTSTSGFNLGSTTTTKASAGFTFGTSATTKASGVSGTFNFNAVAPTTVSSGLNIGSNNKTGGSSTFQFGGQNSSTADSSTFSFGSRNPSATTQSGSTNGTFQFGGITSGLNTTVPNNTNSSFTGSTHGFGGTCQCNVVTCTAGGLFSFGTNNTSTTTVQSGACGITTAATGNFNGGMFGTDITTQSKDSKFQFSGTNKQTVTNSSVNNFSFGQSNPSLSTNVTNNSGFNFGQTSDSIGKNKSDPTKPFGSTSNNTGNGIFSFGSTNSQNGQQNHAGNFGNTAPGFGTSNAPAQSPFGNNPSAFGATNNTATLTGTSFGGTTNSQVDQTKPYDFSKSTGSSFNFGAQNQQKPPTFGTTAGANFSGGTANNNNLFGTPNTAQGAGGNMFSAGSTGTAPRPRSKVAARRRVVKK